MWGSSYGGHYGHAWNQPYNNMAFQPMVSWSYNGQWQGHHDMYLRAQIDRVYAQYDYNYTGQLEGQEFYFAYRDLCVSVGQSCPAPNDFWTIRQIAAQADTNFDGRISKL